MKRLAAFVLAVTFLTACVARITQIVPMPVVAVLLLDTADTALGRTGCDLVGNPYILIHPTLRATDVRWVVIHEQVHVAQMRVHPGGCVGFEVQYELDDTFRLHAEADAFCATYEAQVREGVDPSPTLASIAWTLAFKYAGPWTMKGTQAAMRCWPPPSKT